MAIQDEDLFRKEMTDVIPMKPDNRVQPVRRDKLSLREQLRRNAASAEPQKNSNPLTLPEQVVAQGPHDIVGLKKNGVQEGVYRKLRLGKYEVQDSLDLHRVRLKDAHQAVFEFLSHAHQQGLRTVLISHGKGQHSPRPGLLKSYVIHWLEEFDLALAYHSAPQRQGGTGATLVLLRKNSEARKENRGYFMEAGRHQR